VVQMISGTSISRESDAEAKLRMELEAVRSRLYRLIQGDREQLGRDDVYRLSEQLDRLILQYMRYSN